MNKSVLMLLLLVLASALCGQADPDSINAPLPFMMNPFFETYSTNYLGASALGRGNTGVSMLGDLDQVLLNPASYYPERSGMIFEIDTKPEISAESYPNEATLKGNSPIGIAGFGLPISEKAAVAFLYSMPRSIKMDAYSYNMYNSTYFLLRYPQYNLHQFTANLAYHGSRLHLGVSLHNQLHMMDDVPFLRTFDRVDDLSYIPRVELGAIYSGDTGNIGATLTLPSNADWDLKYKEYDSLLPLKIGVGTVFHEGPRNWILDAEYEQFSALHADFNDRLKIKAGFEFTKANTVYRLGYQYSPAVYEGFYRIPVNTTASSDTSNVWDSVITAHPVGDCTQHLLSAGISYYHRYGSVNLGYMQSLSKEAPFTQLSLGLSFYWDAIIRSPKEGEDDEDFGQYSQDRKL